MYSDFSHLLLSHRQDGWRSDEIDMLVDNCTLSRKLIAQALGRTPLSVNKQIMAFRLTNGGGDYAWSAEELAFLERSINKITLKKICQTLFRNAIDVKHMSIRLGVSKKDAFKQFTGRTAKATQTFRSVSLCLEGESHFRT
jgi:hypothetical protein